MTTLSGPRARRGADTGIAPTATVEDGALVGPGTRVGERCKIQNHSLLHEPAVLEDGVFIGPAVVLTKDTYLVSDTHDRWVCPTTGEVYLDNEGRLEEAR